MDKLLPFVSHLDALRKCILVCAGILICSTALCMMFAPRFLEILKVPAGGLVTELYYFSPEEPLLVYMQVGFFCGLVAAFPVIIYVLWSFIAPAFSREFRLHTVIFAAACFMAFLTGCMFGYFVLLPGSLRFLLAIGGNGLRPLISAGRYVSFTTGLTLACGGVFLMPVFVFLLARHGLVTAGFMRRQYPLALAAILIIAAAITPTTDVFNMLVMALPMLALYEVSIWIAFFFRKKESPDSNKEDEIYGETARDV
jgi:sec-independent protein translocase protein TatC